MTINIEPHYVDMYSGHVQHLLQEKGGVLSETVDRMQCHGEQANVVNQYGQSTMSEVTARFEPMGRADPTTDRVWLSPRSFDVNHMVDTFDKLKLDMTDPDSELVKAAHKAAKRQMDEVVRDAFFGTIVTGQRGGSSTAFSSTHVVDAAEGNGSTDTGLTVEKILHARYLLEDADVDLDDPENMVCMAITPRQHLDLMNQSKVINGDYFKGDGRAVLENGKLRYYAGTRIIVTKFVPTDGTYRNVPMWVKPAMKLGIWADVKTQVDPRPDIRGRPFQAYVTMSINATRVENGKVIKIECTES